MSTRWTSTPREVGHGPTCTRSGYPDVLLLQRVLLLVQRPIETTCVAQYRQIGAGVHVSKYIPTQVIGIFALLLVQLRDCLVTVREFWVRELGTERFSG